MGSGSAAFPVVEHRADFCVVGGGMAGLCAALAAARHGARVVLMHERPVLGGNASSECRMHIGGADRGNAIPNLRETGILEELRLENLLRNPQRSYSVWDAVLYDKARYQPNLELLLNCTCTDAEMDGRRIASVSGWQLTTQTIHRVKASLFADCSGDAVLAPLTGAEFRMGREGRDEHGESIAPEVADRRTMGMTCLFQTQQHATPKPFTSPPWANRYDRCEDLPYGRAGHDWIEMGYWWVELGGEGDSIRDAEQARDELLKIVYGVWDHIKNRCPDAPKAANWALDWIQFLPGKRESRRYLAGHMLTQGDIDAEGRFEDIVAYGGWTMDDHHPAGFRAVKLGAPATIFHEAPSPYGIPYRSLYSRSVANLLCAGRCHGATHTAMSSTRVMGTCAAMGQAVGTAAAIAARLGITPREVGGHIHELQQTLLRDDCYLPWVAQEFGPLTMAAKLSAWQGDPSPLRDGFSRPVGTNLHAWRHKPGDWVEMLFEGPKNVAQTTLVLDSALHRNIQMSHLQADDQLTNPPPELQKDFTVEGLVDGQWVMLAHPAGNHQRLFRLPVNRRVAGLRYALQETWGPCEGSNLYAFYVD